MRSPERLTAGPAAGALCGSKFWGGKVGLTLRNWQGGGAAPSCLAFKCEWHTALR